MELEDIRLQVGSVYVGAWWGQKAEILKKCWFLKLFLKEHTIQGARQSAGAEHGYEKVLVFKAFLTRYVSLYVCNVRKSMGF